MPKHVFMLAAAVMLLNGAAVAHSWYPKNAATTRTVIRSHAKKSKKSVTAGCGATKRPNNVTGFRTIDCTRRTMTLVTFAFRHGRRLAAFVFMCRCQHESLSRETFDNRGAHAGALLVSAGMLPRQRMSAGTMR